MCGHTAQALSNVPEEDSCPWPQEGSWGRSPCSPLTSCLGLRAALLPPYTATPLGRAALTCPFNFLPPVVSRALALLSGSHPLLCRNCCVSVDLHAAECRTSWLRTLLSWVFHLPGCSSSSAGLSSSPRLINIGRKGPLLCLHPFAGDLIPSHGLIVTHKPMTPKCVSPSWDLNFRVLYPAPCSAPPRGCLRFTTGHLDPHLFNLNSYPSCSHLKPAPLKPAPSSQVLEPKPRNSP